ncbi:radical SAM protein [candidate division WOR-3 bacterium]|nr:radical SAM protein [candidate division WOR-3 bacterium]
MKVEVEEKGKAKVEAKTSMSQDSRSSSPSFPASTSTLTSTSSSPYSSISELPHFELWDRMKERRAPIAFDLEVTARCNNNCRHCYINLPAGDSDARAKELSLAGIERIAREAVSLGAMWCLLTGGEPLLREDFFDLYLMLKRLGVLVSVFTNACLVKPEHVELFRKYPPRDVEVTMYGASEATYERVTRRPGSYRAFVRGLDLLLSSGVKVRLKAMALRSNVHELHDIARFCRARTKDYYRFDPVLHLRYDRDPVRNAEIQSERLSPDEVVAVEHADEERFGALKKGCDKLILPEPDHAGCNHLFHCGTGMGSFSVSFDGQFRLCSSLWHPDTVYDLRHGTLLQAWEQHVPSVRELRSRRQEFLERCRVCPIINLCLWCPAHSYLETGEMDAVVDYFCQVAHARARMLGHEQDRRLRTEDGERG